MHRRWTSIAAWLSLVVGVSVGRGQEPPLEPIPLPQATLPEPAQPVGPSLAPATGSAERFTEPVIELQETPVAPANQTPLGSRVVVAPALSSSSPLAAPAVTAVPMVSRQVVVPQVPGVTVRRTSSQRVVQTTTYVFDRRRGIWRPASLMVVSPQVARVQTQQVTHYAPNGVVFRTTSRQVIPEVSGPPAVSVSAGPIQILGQPVRNAIRRRHW